MNKEEANPVQTKRFSEREQEQPLRKSVKKKKNKKEETGRDKEVQGRKSGGKRNVAARKEKQASSTKETSERSCETE